MKLQRLKNGQFVLTLPKTLILAKNWKKGQEISISVDDKGRLVLS